MISTALKYLLIDKCLDVFFDKISTNLAIVPAKNIYTIGQLVETIVVKEEDSAGIIIYWNCKIIQSNIDWIEIEYNMSFHTSFHSTRNEAKDEYDFRMELTGNDPDVIHSMDGTCVTTTWRKSDSVIILLDEIIDSKIMRVTIK